MLLGERQRMNDSQELADVVGAERKFFVKQLFLRARVHSLVFHYTGIPAAGCIHGDTVPDDLLPGNRRPGRFAFGGNALADVLSGALLQCFFRFLFRTEGFVQRLPESINLRFAFLPGSVHARPVPFPHYVVLFFLCHELLLKMVKVEAFMLLQFKIYYFCPVMAFIDTHAHLYLRQFDHDREAMLDRAQAAGVHHFFLPNIDSSSIEDMLALEAAHPDCCFAMMGVHPSHIKENYKDELAIAKKWLDQRFFSAVGEIGIDLYWDKTFLPQQIEALNIQMEWAKELGLPIVLHTREAMDLCIDLVRNAHDDRLHGVFHCFGGTVAQAEQIIEMGFLLGIGGVITYKNGGLEPVIEAFGLEHVVLETDAPYLAPNPYRGKRNESAYVSIVAQRLAELSALTPEEVAQKTSANARHLFEETFVSLQSAD